MLYTLYTDISSFFNFITSNYICEDPLQSHNGVTDISDSKSYSREQFCNVGYSIAYDTDLFMRIVKTSKRSKIACLGEKHMDLKRSYNIVIAYLQ